MCRPWPTQIHKSLLLWPTLAESLTVLSLSCCCHHPYPPFNLLSALPFPLPCTLSFFKTSFDAMMQCCASPLKPLVSPWGATAVTQSCSPISTGFPYFGCPSEWLFPNLFSISPNVKRATYNKYVVNAIYCGAPGAQLKDCQRSTHG